MLKIFDDLTEKRSQISKSMQKKFKFCKLEKEEKCLSGCMIITLLLISLFVINFIDQILNLCQKCFYKS
jgi:hypothetical protein